MEEGPIRGQSVAEIAYQRIRGQITNGTFPPNARLNQGELADSFGISRTSVREALHRLAAETLVEFRRHRGFFVAAPLPLGAVLHRLEVRVILEPGIARLAAQRASAEDVAAIRAAVDSESSASTPLDAHDLSREFHLRVAKATGNEDLVRILGSLWSVDVGRQLLSLRVMSPTWQPEDVAEHRAIAEAIAESDGDRAAELMHQHVADALAHWSRRASESPADADAADETAHAAPVTPA